MPVRTTETLTPTEVLKILRISQELILHQPSIIHGVINVPDEDSSEVHVGGARTAIVYLSEHQHLEGTPVDQYRESLEKMRVSTEPLDPSKEIERVLKQLRPPCTAFGGAINLDEVDLILQQVAEFPQYISCRNVRMKLFELPPSTFHSVMRLITDIKERLRVPGVTLCEIPPESTSRTSLEQLSYILLTNDEIPIAKLAVSQQRDEVLCKPFATNLLRELRDRVATGLQQVQQRSLSRIRRRDVDQAMLNNSLDLSDTFLDPLTIVANSWKGKEIPTSRVSLLLNSRLLDPHFSVTEDGQIIRYLHEAELTGN